MKRVILFLGIFFLFLPFVISREAKVLYFWNTRCSLCKSLEDHKNGVKETWKNLVEWEEYNFSNSTHREKFYEYNIRMFPTAVLECGDRRYFVRQEIGFSLNDSIAECLGFENKHKTINYLIPIAVVGAIIFIILIIKKYKISHVR